MKAFFVEYANIIAKTTIGLIFGVSFFLLFLNFYHYKEIHTTYTPQKENTTNYDTLMEQVNQIKANAQSYSQNTYRGTENVYDMLGLQAKLNFCVAKVETEELKNLLAKESYTVQEVYDLVIYYQDEILNDCIVLQLYSLGDAATSPIQSARLKQISPFLRSQMDMMLNNGTGYLKNSLRNNDIYHFSNEDSKNNVFELTKDSYNEIMNRYKTTLEFIKTLSEWYKTMVIGG